MGESHDSKSQQNPVASDPTQPQLPPSKEGIKNNGSHSGHKAHFPNPPESVNPDPATLRDQWRFAIRQYSRWYSQAWGTAILAGGAFFALGWIIKGGNPLPSKDSNLQQHQGKTNDHEDR